MLGVTALLAADKANSALDVALNEANLASEKAKVLVRLLLSARDVALKAELWLTLYTLCSLTAMLNKLSAIASKLSSVADLLYVEASAKASNYPCNNCLACLAKTLLDANSVLAS